jgi:hypothetical protein
LEPTYWSSPFPPFVFVFHLIHPPSSSTSLIIPIPFLLPAFSKSSTPFPYLPSTSSIIFIPVLIPYPCLPFVFCNLSIPFLYLPFVSSN